MLPMTIRDVFEIVKRHLLHQMARATAPVAGGSDRCAYRGRNGMTCAAGCLIADEHYKPEMEGLTVDHPSVSQALNLSGVPIFDDAGYANGTSMLGLIARMQHIHDNYRPDQWSVLIEGVGKEYHVA